MRRRSVIAGAGAALLAAPARGAESTILPSQLPEGTKQIARFVNLPDRPRMIRLTERPPNYETPVDVFTETVTPNRRFYVRYHLAGIPTADDMYGWTLSIQGDAVTKPIQFRMNDLLDMASSEILAVCQCAGDRRGLSIPHVAGVQWGDGAVGCSVWRGPTLADVLKTAGVTGDALEVWFGGADKPALDATPPYRRSLPIKKALDPNTIIAISMNNAPLPQWNGYPARLVVPGWIGAYWMKHLTTIEVSNKPLDNVWMRDAYQVRPGLFPPGDPFPSQATATSIPLTNLVVNSLIGDPLEGHEVDRGGFTIRGVAWDGGNGVNRVEISLDGGHTWQDSLLDRPLGRFGFRKFSLETGLMAPGPIALMSRATSQSGERQVDRLRVNPGGYLNNLPKPIPVTVT